MPYPFSTGNSVTFGLYLGEGSQFIDFIIFLESFDLRLKIGALAL
jgi:hypothetical protein